MKRTNKILVGMAIEGLIVWIAVIMNLLAVIIIAVGCYVVLAFLYMKAKREERQFEKTEVLKNE